MYRRTVVAALVLASVLQSATVEIARADMLVLESNVPEIKVGSRLPDEPNVPPGGRVRVLLPSNETKVFEHPASASDSRSITEPVGGTRRLHRPN